MKKAIFRQPIKFDYDLIVIGSGIAGSLAAHTAANFNRKVALIEKDKLGGECPNTSCIPTRALLESAKTIDLISSSKKHGVRFNNLEITYEAALLQKTKAINNTGILSQNAYSSHKIDIVKGSAHFISPWQVNVGMRRITAKKFIISSGSYAYIPSIPGLEDAKYITYSDIGEMSKLPKSLAIIGGGAVAYEYSQICSAFGTKVYIIEKADHLLPQLDVEIGDIAEAELTKKGISINLKSKIKSISKTAKGKVVCFSKNGHDHRIITDEILVATGKRPNIDLGLENTTIKYDETGIKINDYCQTNQSHIYAIGDVAYSSNKYTLSNLASLQARIAVNNIYKHKKHSTKNIVVPVAIHGLPEIASVGKTEQQLVLAGEIYQSAIAPIGIVAKSMATDYSAGFVKILTTSGGTIIGASIVAPDAAEMISTLTLAIQYRHKACDLANILYPIPSWSEAIRIACSKILCI